jgi:hypothetical protein
MGRIRIVRKIKLSRRRLAAVAGVLGVASGALMIGTAGTASASTIQYDYVQLCSQGGYGSYLYEPYDDSYTQTVPPGQCYWWSVSPSNTWIEIDVYDDQGDLLSPFWYNGSVSGLGIGTETSDQDGSRYTITW